MGEGEHNRPSEIEHTGDQIRALFGFILDNARLAWYHSSRDSMHVLFLFPVRWRLVLLEHSYTVSDRPAVLLAREGYHPVSHHVVLLSWDALQRLHCRECGLLHDVRYIPCRNTTQAGRIRGYLREGKRIIIEDTSENIKPFQNTWRHVCPWKNIWRIEDEL